MLLNVLGGVLLGFSVCHVNGPCIETQFKVPKFFQSFQHCEDFMEEKIDKIYVEMDKLVPDASADHDVMYFCLNDETAINIMKDRLKDIERAENRIIQERSI